MSKILLVEDDNWFAHQQMRILSAAGHDVMRVSDAQSAIDAVEHIAPQAVVLDILLIYNTAFALLHELQSYQETSTLPVVVYTTQAEALDDTSLKPYGVHAILDKTTMHPIDTVRALARLGL